MFVCMSIQRVCVWLDLAGGVSGWCSVVSVGVGAVRVWDVA